MGCGAGSKLGVCCSGAELIRWSTGQTSVILSLNTHYTSLGVVLRTLLMSSLKRGGPSQRDGGRTWRGLGASTVCGPQSTGSPTSRRLEGADRFAVLIRPVDRRDRVARVFTLVGVAIDDRCMRRESLNRGCPRHPRTLAEMQPCSEEAFCGFRAVAMCALHIPSNDTMLQTFSAVHCLPLAPFSPPVFSSAPPPSLLLCPSTPSSPARHPTCAR